MAQSILYRVAILVVSLAGASGCNDREVTSPSSATTSEVELSFSSLSTREDAHHQFAINSNDTDALRAETLDYATDMDSLIKTMIDACEAMGFGGMMGGHQMARMNDLADGMHDRIREHLARMDSLSSLEDMRAECTGHHDDMWEMLDEMHNALPSGHMMDGSMDDGHGGM
jgi:hypothetical protein